MALRWEPFRRRVKNWDEVEKLVSTVQGNLDGTHTPNTISTAVFGPLANPKRTSQNYNHAEEFALDGIAIKALFPDLCSHREPVAAQYRSSVLLFKRDIILGLQPEQRFRIVTPYGCYVMSRNEFETTFKNVATNKQSFLERGSYHYRWPPSQAQQFRDFDERRYGDDERLSIRDLLDTLVENKIIDADDAAVELEDESLFDDGVPEASDVDTRYDARNVILFGPPGTGKSFRIQTSFIPAIGIPRDADDSRVYRITFHPETSYFDFVGTYKPLLATEAASTRTFDSTGVEFLWEGKPARPLVYYGFEPGPFSECLIAALKEPRKNHALVIEEVNRGNCAAIFGDVFQLLDRDENHESQYSIRPSAQLGAYIATKLGRAVPVLRLPPNFFIYATMNTSDQSLFPMDTAFKRRWTMEYVGISFEDPSVQRVLVPLLETTIAPWWVVATVLNQRIVATTGVDDKQMGPYFVKAEVKDQVTPSSFRSKVLFYLWNDVFRGNTTAVFESGIETYDVLVARHSAGKQIFSKEVLHEIAARTSEETPL
jgi:hypothetical protein